MPSLNDYNLDNINYTYVHGNSCAMCGTDLHPEETRSYCVGCWWDVQRQIRLAQEETRRHNEEMLRVQTRYAEELARFRDSPSAIYEALGTITNPRSEVSSVEPPVGEDTLTRSGVDVVYEEAEPIPHVTFNSSGQQVNSILLHPGQRFDYVMGGVNYSFSNDRSYDMTYFWQQR